MAQTAQEYFKQLFAEAGIDDATAGTVLTHFANPKVAEKVNGVLKTAQDDYTAQVGRQQAAEKKLNDYAASAQTWYKQTETQYNAAVAELAALKAQQNGGYQDPPAIDTSKFLTKEDMLRVIQERDKAYAGVAKTMARLSSRHATKFGEELDVDALEKIALDHNLPSLELAYDRYVAPREEAKRNTDMEAKIKAARDEGARDALSRHKLPVDAAPQSVGPISRYAKSGGDKSGMATEDELVNLWNSAGQ